MQNLGVFLFKSFLHLTVIYSNDMTKPTPHVHYITIIYTNNLKARLPKKAESLSLNEGAHIIQQKRLRKSWACHPEKPV